MQFVRLKERRGLSTEPGARDLWVVADGVVMLCEGERLCAGVPTTDIVYGDGARLNVAADIGTVLSAFAMIGVVAGCGDAS